MKIQNIMDEQIFLNLDKKRELRIDMFAMCEYERLFGETFMTGAERIIKDIQNPSMITLRNMLYSGLKHEDESLTPEKVSKMFSFKVMAEIKAGLLKGMKLGLPDAEDIEPLESEGKPGMIPGKAAKNVGKATGSIGN